MIFSFIMVCIIFIILVIAIILILFDFDFDFNFNKWIYSAIKFNLAWELKEFKYNKIKISLNLLLTLRLNDFIPINMLNKHSIFLYTNSLLQNITYKQLNFEIIVFCKVI